MTLHDVAPASIALALWILAWSTMAFVFMVYDKRQARRAKRRVRERTLIVLALVGGAPGGWLAMHLVRHKTRHIRFRIVLPVFTLLWVALAVVTWRP